MGEGWSGMIHLEWLCQQLSQESCPLTVSEGHSEWAEWP